MDLLKIIKAIHPLGHHIDYFLAYQTVSQALEQIVFSLPQFWVVKLFELL